MTTALGLRTRLTAFVSLAFAVTISAIALAAANQMEADLVDGTRSGAENVLAAYLTTLNGGVASVGVVDESTSTSFFYRDDAGNAISERDYVELLSGAFEAELDAIFAQDRAGTVDVFQAGTFAVGPIDPSTEGLVGDPLDAFVTVVDPETGELLDSSGDPLLVSTVPTPTGDPQSVDLGDAAVGMAQELALPDGSVVTVGVSTPLTPVTAGVDALRRLLAVAVPVLTVVVGAITWLAATRALRPVHRISAEARAISGSNLDRRLPVPPADDAIAELSVTVNEMLGRLERSARRQQQLVSDASHELRSPVTASRAQLEVALATPNTVDWTTTAEVVLAEQEQLGTLIDDLLALSRIREAGANPSTPLELRPLVVEEVDRPRETPVEIMIADEVAVGAERLVVSRAIRNLVDNAARHADVMVQVRLRVEGERAVVTVDDDGCGVPIDQRDMIFERFTRLDDARTRTAGGTGLGLAIVKEGVEAAGGSVACADSPLGGARFEVSLPRLR
ncbi:MAG: ATP-binding protein [Actinomycetota bacterium]